MYEISSYTKEKAKGLGVVVKPSIVKGKKIDVFKNDKKIASIGAIGYKDYPSYLKEDGKEIADKHRKLYKIRHAKDLKSGNGFWANKLLW
jgi:hypothetical protein